jgi:hypothetical protein
MFITNPESIKHAYVCGKIKANYLIKHYNVRPFWFKKNLFYFSIKDLNVDLPWYIKMLK